jgi:phenylalanyl-tRNA synthetase beta chain
MARILTNVEFIVDASSDELKVTQPFWRTDIEIKEDLVEEIGRLYGYFKLKRKLPSRKINPAAKNPELEINSLLRNDLSSAGANEVISSTLIHGDLVNKAQQETNLSHQIANALSPDLQYYRLSLTPSLLDLVYSNIRSNQGVT